MSEWSYYPFIAFALRLWEPIGFGDFIDFGCFRKASFLKDSVVMNVIQNLPHWGKVVWSNMLFLFRNEY